MTQRLYSLIVVIIILFCYILLLFKRIEFVLILMLKRNLFSYDSGSADNDVAVQSHDLCIILSPEDE